jgi:ribosomal protein L14E/L6E/L27E
MEIGTIVISNAGRDKGRYAVVVGYDGYMMIADGKMHKISKPKRKNIKHLILTNEKIDVNDLTDKALRRLFHGVNQPNGSESKKAVS